MSSKFRILKRDLRGKISANITGASTQASTPAYNNYVPVMSVQTSGGIDVSELQLHGATSPYQDVYNATTKQISRRFRVYKFTGYEPFVISSWSHTTRNPFFWSGFPGNNISSGDIGYGNYAVRT